MPISNDSHVAKAIFETMPARIGERIKELRVKHDITQRKLAEELSISQSLLAKIELGTRQIQVVDLIKIANFFDVSCDYLIVGIESENEDASEKYGLSNQALNTLKEMKTIAEEKINKEDERLREYAVFAAIDEADFFNAVNFLISEEKGRNLLVSIHEYLNRDYEALIAPFAFLEKKREELLDKEAFDAAVHKDQEYLNMMGDLDMREIFHFSDLLCMASARTNPKLFEDCAFWEIMDELKNWRQEVQNAPQK